MKIILSDDTSLGSTLGGLVILMQGSLPDHVGQRGQVCWRIPLRINAFHSGLHEQGAGELVLSRGPLLSPSICQYWVSVSRLRRRMRPGITAHVRVHHLSPFVETPLRPREPPVGAPVLVAGSTPRSWRRLRAELVECL
jgi:hypothetical protein